MACVSSRNRSLMAFTWSSIALTAASTADRSAILLAGYTVNSCANKTLRLMETEIGVITLKWIDGNSLFRAMTSSWSCVIRALKEDIKESSDAPALFPFIALSHTHANRTMQSESVNERYGTFRFDLGASDLKETTSIWNAISFRRQYFEFVFITSFRFLRLKVSWESSYAMYG